MLNIDSPEFSRNYGFWNEAEQDAIMRSSVAIAGVGGDGFQLGLKLARMGVASFDIADPETFERENINRVPGATIATCGRNKAEVFRAMALEINPHVDVRIYKDGVTEENIEEFTNRADVVFDETELTHLELGTMVSDAARNRGIPDVFIMNVGFAGQITSFHPKGRHSFRTMMGIPKNMPLDEVKDLSLDISRCLPYLPAYADSRTLAAVANDEDAPLPSIAPGVDVASALGASQGFLHLVQATGNKRPEPIWAPRFGYMDAYTCEAGTTRVPRLSFYRRLATMMVREKFSLNPQASFTQADRERRQASDQLA